MESGEYRIAGVDRPRSGSALPELVIMCVFVVAGWWIAHEVDAFEWFAAWSREHETLQLDEILIALNLLVVAGAVFSIRRWRQYRAELDRRRTAESRLEVLERIIPICASCRRIRDEGAWLAPEVYVSRQENTAFSHGLCPECLRELDWADEA